jgi:peptidoglycan hydrolase-like protein with peptidoglycan-binding domain
MKAIIRALIGFLALSVCLVLAAPSAAARTTPAAPGAVTAAAPAAATPDLPAWPVISQGSAGQPVRSLQYLLNARGAWLAVDSIFGAKTNAAVRTFQGAHGLAVDGTVGPKTWRSLIITVQRGSVGSAVKAVQDQANFRGGRGEGPPVLVVDGVFGPSTQQWVKGFQGAAGLVPDGIVGPLTWQALIGGLFSG